MLDSLLLVDDEPEITSSTRWALEAQGYQVTTAASAEEAFRYLQALHPKVLLIDFKLPGASGTEFLKWARALDPSIPAILITGFSDACSYLESDCEKLGACTCLFKPLQVDTVLQAVKEAIENNRRKAV